MVDSIYRTRSLGAPASGLKDQYADGKAAKLWEVYIGDTNARTTHYRSFITKLLREKGCKKILDVACGTGVDSIMLLEEGFQVTSVDASDKMLKYAIKTRWNRRDEPGFAEWDIEEANWLTLSEDIHKPDEGFDAVICLGNSFAHLPDFEGDLVNQRVALSNFEEFVKPGGYLLIDHRNYDFILDHGKTPKNNIYYNSSHIANIKTSVLFVNGKANMVTLDYSMNTEQLEGNKDVTDTAISKKGRYAGVNQGQGNIFRLSYYPHRLENFRELLNETFPEGSTVTSYGDFKVINSQTTDPPAFYIHFVEKAV